MFEKIIESGKNGFKPVSDIMSINAKAIEKLASQQGSFVTSVLSDGMKQAKELTSIRDVTGFVEAQKTYAEGMQQKVVENARQTLELMSDTRASATSIVESAFSKEDSSKVQKASTSKKAN